MACTKKTGRRGCVGEKGLFFANCRSGTPACRQATLEKLRVLRVRLGYNICRETGLKVRVITTGRETFNWVCCNLNEEGEGRGDEVT